MEQPKALTEVLECPRCGIYFSINLSDECAHNHCIGNCNHRCQHFYCSGGCCLVDRKCHCGYVITARMLHTRHSGIVRYLGDFNDMPHEVLQLVIAGLPDEKVNELREIFDRKTSKKVFVKLHRGTTAETDRN